jgi:hypothetical protein
MNDHHHPDREDLLDDLLPVGNAPAFDSVLARLRRDHANRRRRHIAATTILVLAAALAVTFLHPWKTPRPATIAQSLPSPVPTPRIERLSDDQLLGAVNRPAALITLPDGRQTLLVLVPGGARQ